MSINKNNIYRKRECEACGKYTFEKWRGTGVVTDGGFTTIDDWEQSGFGSIVVNYWDITSVDESRFEYRLCPDCAKKLDSCIHSKINELRAEKDA